MKTYIYGKNAANNSLSNNKTISKVFLLDSYNDKLTSRLLKEKNFAVKKMTNDELNKLVGKVNHQGIVIECEDYQYLTLEELISSLKDVQYPCIALLDQIEDPHNFGAIIRSGDALGIDGYIILDRRQVQVTSVVSHVSTGAIEYAKIARVNNLNKALETLKENGYWVVASDGNASLDYREVDYKMKTVLIIGSEGKGISQLLLKNSDFITKIPMVGHVNSFNASVAAALYFAAVYDSKHR